MCKFLLKREKVCKAELHALARYSSTYANHRLTQRRMSCKLIMAGVNFQEITKRKQFLKIFCTDG